MATSIGQLGREYGINRVKMPRWKQIVSTLLPVLLIFGFCLFFKGIDSCPHAVTLNPNTGIQGQALTVVFTDPGATNDEWQLLNDISFGPGITVYRNWILTTPTTLVVNIYVGGDAAPGPRNVIATYPGGTVYSLANPLIGTGTTSHSAAIVSNSGTGQQSPVVLPTLAVQSASLSTARVPPGTPVTVNAVIANTGAVNGAMAVKLYVNGQEEAARGVAVDSGKTAPITFNISRSQPGTYTVNVGGVSAGSFTVDELTDGNVILIVSASLLATALVIGIIFLVRRKQFNS
jgi:hypothetical protein